MCMGKDLKCHCAKKEIKHISDLLKTIAEDNRLKIICLLGKGELCVCQIMEALDLPNNLTSHHLKVLTRSGVISQRRQGRFRFYRINNKKFSAFKREFNSLMGG